MGVLLELGVGVESCVVTKLVHLHKPLGEQEVHGLPAFLHEHLFWQVLCLEQLQHLSLVRVGKPAVVWLVSFVGVAIKSLVGVGSQSPLDQNKAKVQVLSSDRS